jgi:hypothetical protein
MAYKPTAKARSGRYRTFSAVLLTAAIAIAGDVGIQEIQRSSKGAQRAQVLLGDIQSRASELNANEWSAAAGRHIDTRTEQSRLDCATRMRDDLIALEENSKPRQGATAPPFRTSFSS